MSSTDKNNNDKLRKKGRPTLAVQLGRQRAGSVGSIEESFKRKREGDREREKAEKEILENFQKQRKIGRSPPKKEKEGEGTKEERDTCTAAEDKDKNMEELTELIKSIKKDTMEIKQENREIKQELKNLKEDWIRRQAEWEKEKREIEERIKGLESKEKEHQDLLERIKRIEKGEEEREKRVRKNNIIIKGEDLKIEATPKQTAEKLIKDELQEEVEIEDAFWIKKNQGENILLAKAKNWQQKKMIMLKKNKLKGKKIYIENDLTKREREIQREIYEIARTEKNKGEKVKIGYKKLQIGEKFFHWKDDETGVEEKKFWSRQHTRNL
ncbi:uncharacterized protein LOC143217494 [Lasioglossum baleicum]|uniref:uncharacterized protein LOC143217494 n=1 Tax=Lasioglossum baleicum TaxID=434251 RepID=UPI003FCD597A